MPMSKIGTWLAVRGDAKADKKEYSDEKLVYFFNHDGHLIGHDTYSNWLAGVGPELKPGQTVQCICTKDSIFLKCPIHAVDLGLDFEGL